MKDPKEGALLLKALSDAKRLMIVDMLSNGELCACRILEAFEMSQPTLSHHMKILCGSGLVYPRKEGKWTHYSLNEERFAELSLFIERISSGSEKSVGCGVDY